ncbi:hypothetical protein CDD81_1972 [Ophiocordyceps australis]|uniref:RNA recognition motif-containing protein n=1 Tax=Ophiocordyceps australis TaxID=1399860 RepID=A0A2C5XYZ8_9HYPO|nr:hypothetical protein CDD81_1972 [Ophiocordyceps australis]
MAARPGEENVATLFGDVHYLYSPPEIKPPHQRFDRGSYVYLFENANERRCRIEIANNPGTSDQDAFDGFLDQTHVRYSYKHHCMVSLKVADNVNMTEWHLPTYDFRNENKYHYKLHSLNVYFWTHQDALQFVNGVRRVLPPSLVDVLDEPVASSQPAVMSSVVQQLESLAVSDPRYRYAATTSSAAPSFAAIAAAPEGSGTLGLPLPPPPPCQPHPTTTAAPTSFAPMAYNPAAPAAPETVRPREKTPPPDEESPDPLALAMAHDNQGQVLLPAPVLHTLAPAAGGPAMAAPQLADPPSHQQQVLQRAATMPTQLQMQPGVAPLGVPNPYDLAASGTPLNAASWQPGMQPTPPVTSAPPCSYLHSSQQGPIQQLSHDYSIHHQVYRPTEVAMGPRSFPHGQVKQEPRGRLEENAAKFERSVTGMLRKIEKKFG